MPFTQWWTQHVATVNPVVTVHDTGADPLTIRWQGRSTDRRESREAVLSTRDVWRACWFRGPPARRERGVALLGASPPWRQEKSIQDRALEVLGAEPRGLLVREISARTRHDENSVRGAMRRLSAEGLATHDPRSSPTRWFAAPEDLRGRPAVEIRAALFGQQHRVTVAEVVLAALDDEPRTSREIAVLVGREVGSVASVLRALSQAGVVNVGEGGPRQAKRYWRAA